MNPFQKGDILTPIHDIPKSKLFTTCECGLVTGGPMMKVGHKFEILEVTEFDGSGYYSINLTIKNLTIGCGHEFIIDSELIISNFETIEKFRIRKIDSLNK